METVQVALSGGPLDGCVVGLDMDLATKYAHSGRFEFVVPRSDVVKMCKELPLEGPECVYSMPIPFPRDGRVEFVSYLSSKERLEDMDLDTFLGTKDPDGE